MGFVVHSCNKTHTGTSTTLLYRKRFDAEKCRQDEVGGEIKYIDLGEGEVVENAVKKSDEERRQSFLVQWVKDLFGRMFN